MMWNFVAGVAILGVPIVLSYAIANLWVAAATCAAVQTIVVHLTSYLGAGYVDPFYVISVPVGLAAFFIWSALELWVFRRIQRRRVK
jgi:hypothetical protein